MDVYICVGSSCHLKGSYYIINTFQELIRKNLLQDKVQLKASFCLGHCTDGVCATVEGRLIENLTPENAEKKFKEFVLRRLKT